MTIEDTTTTGQQPNPGDGDASATTAANPNADQSTATGDAPGQGDGGDAAGGDNAGEQGKTGESGDGTGDDPNAAVEFNGAPEAYADFKLPEGIVLEGARKDAAVELFRKMNLSQDGAQAAVDHFIRTMGEDDAARTVAMEAAVAQQRDDWGRQAKAELGEKYDGEVAMAKTAVQAMQNPKLVEAFDEQGWGNHPELIKAFAFFGKMMRDSPVDGIGNSGNAPVAQTPWDAMYPDMNEKK